MYINRIISWLYAAVLLCSCQPQQQRVSIGGFWRIETPYGEFGVELNDKDSTYRENAFNTSGKWKIKPNPLYAGDLVLYAQDDRFNVKTILNRLDGELTLTDGLVMQRADEYGTPSLSRFGKFASLLKGGFPFPVSYEIRDAAIKEFAPDTPETVSAIDGSIMARHRQFWIANLTAYGFNSLMAVDTMLQASVPYGRIDGSEVPGECSTSFERNEGSMSFGIKATQTCAEGDPTSLWFELNDNGDFVRVEAIEGDNLESLIFDEGFKYAPSDNESEPKIGSGYVKEFLAKISEKSNSDKFIKRTLQLDGTDGGIGLYIGGLGAIKENFYYLIGDKNPFHTDTLSGFNYYNPDFIEWLSGQIPEPTDKVLGVTAQEIYAKVFRRMARIYTLAYTSFESPEAFLSAQQDYKTASQTDGFYGPDYLAEKYAESLKQYQAPVQAYRGDYMSPSQAYGFWLRRGFDGTDAQCWRVLSQAMQKYDLAWMKEHNLVQQ